jgi:hypothetical protein
VYQPRILAMPLLELPLDSTLLDEPPQANGEFEVLSYLQVTQHHNHLYCYHQQHQLKKPPTPKANVWLTMPINVGLCFE